MLWMYITQGFNELNVLVLGDSLNHAYGLMQFPQIGQVLSKLFNLNLKYDVFQELPRAGTYLTLYGASYIDFGHGGALLFCGCLGWFTGKSIAGLHKGVINGLTINAPLFITIGIFSPLVSLVSNMWPALFWGVIVGSRLQRAHQKAALI